MRKTRGSIITSAISLLLCIIMLAGSTFAWFTDVVANNGNVIQSGNLNAQLHWSDRLLDTDSSEWIDAEGSKVFDYDRWEPGYTELRYIKVTNAGSLNLKWKLTIEANGPVSSLADVIDVYYVNPVTSEFASVDGLDSAGTLTEVMAEKTSSQGRLTPNQNTILAIAFHMDEFAGNEYQKSSLCDNGFSLKLLATQDIGESDSFGDDYDTDADFGEGAITFTASAPISQVPIIYGALADDITIGSGSNVSAILPSGVKVADGATSLDLSVSAVATDSNITLEEGDSATSLDVHVYGVAEDNTIAMIVNLGAVLEAGLADTELKLYHTENGNPVLMTRVDSTSDFAIHNQYTYNAETGEVSIYVKSFSVFSAVKTTPDVWDGSSVADGFESGDGTEQNPYVIKTAAQLVYFSNEVDDGNTFADKTIKLGVDIDLNNKLFNPIGGGWAYTGGNTFNGTFDGDGHTIYNIYVNGWQLDEAGDTHTSTSKGAGLFSSIHNATIKNLAIVGGEMRVETTSIGVVVGCAQGMCAFENIVVSGVKVGNYQMRNGGIVGDIYVIESDNVPKDSYSHTFKNIVVDSSITLSSMWGDFDTGNGGIVGGKYGSAKVLMENVTVAAKLDVFSDVTAAYQWYAYRRCGMLVGYTGENSPKQATNASADFLTCSNVNVYYGDWANYTYYQFTNQDSSWQSNYPWVRAEESPYNGPFSNVRYGNPVVNGVKINTIELAESNKTDFVAITFNQLYGGGQGVYGTNHHDGVTVFGKNTKTVYIHNNASWTNLKLDYWYKHGEEIWTNLIESIALSPVEEGSTVYKIVVPAYAEEFKIISVESVEGKTFELSKLADGEHIDLEGNHIHAFVNQECVCGAVIFEFGANQNISHSDGSGTTEYTETVGEYTLILTDMKAVYKSANDALGNSCLKLGTNSVNATFTFTVPENTKEAIIYVAKYKDNKSVITVNGTKYELTKNSDDGEYDEIVIDTTETKTITLITDQDAKRCMVNSIVFVVEKLDHLHSYESVVTNPTCTKDGYITYTCSICDHSYVEVDEKKTGHSYKEEITTNATCTENGEKIYTCSVCGDSQTEEIDALGHNYVDGICSVCGDELENKDVWQLVTDASTLQAGDKIVIVAKEYNLALSTTQNNNNRGQATVSKVDDTITFGDDVQIITLEVGTTSGTYAFNTGSGYLYAASSGSNYLKTETTLSDNSSWKITIAADGTATIVAQGTNIRNTMQYNQQSSLFACYASASQKEISIYKLVGDSGNEGGETPCEHTNTTETTTATCTDPGVKTVTCNDCDETVSTKEIGALGHTTENGICERCGNEIGGDTPVAKDPVVFEFGDNGSASHVDGNSIGSSKTYTEGTATLKLTGMSNVYGPAYDAKGNSCIKLGASSKAGSGTITVDADVTSVVIKVAKYKTNTTKITINGTTYTLTKNSNDGAYDEIVIDTTTTKTITFTTVSGGYRAMINSVTYNYD